MIVFTFDGSFEGFLTCVYEGYYSNKPDKIINKNKYIYSFLEKEVFIDRDLEKSSRVCRAIEEKLGEEILKKIYTVCLSDIEGSYTVLFNYLILAFKIGPSVNMYKQNTYVNEVDKMERRVKSEAHRFTGFVRFKEVCGVLFAKIEPDHDILELIMRHFTNRFRNEKFIIYDEKRDKAVIYNGEMGSIITNAKSKFDGIEDIKDGFYENLWKDYYKSTTIKERENKNLQMKKMPKKYWKNLIETKSQKY